MSCERHEISLKVKEGELRRSDSWWELTRTRTNHVIFQEIYKLGTN